MPLRKKKRGGGFTTTAAAAAAVASAADDDDVDNDDVSLPRLSKKAFLAKTRADDAARANAAAAKAGTTAAAAAVAPAGATTAAGVAVTYAASGAATTRAIILPQLPIFPLNQGLANDMGRKSAAPATVSVPTALVAAAAAGRAEAGKAASDVTIPRNQSPLTTAAAASVPTADDGESLGSGFDFHYDISFQVVVIWEVLKMRV